MKGECGPKFNQAWTPGPLEVRDLIARSDGVPEVHLDVLFLEMLWAFIYSWMVLYEEGGHRPMLPGTSLPTGAAPGGFA